MIGLEKKKWICIHNRDSSYLKNLAQQSNFKNYNFPYHNYRDSDVNKLIESTKLLIEKNFYVFRMGKIQSNEMNFKTIYPDLKFCGDNAAMIAWTGIQRFKKNLIDDVDVSAKSRWPLDKDAPYMKGPELKL